MSHEPIKVKRGFVYKLTDFTAHKVFNGLNFECLLTDQMISHKAGIEEEICHISDYTGEVYNPERFNILKITKHLK